MILFTECSCLTFVPFLNKCLFRKLSFKQAINSHDMKQTSNPTKILTLIILWLLGAPLFAQQNIKRILPDVANATSSSAHEVRPTADGGYILTGTAEKNAPANYGSFVRAAKLDAALQVQWDRVYEEPGNPFGHSIRYLSAAWELPDGGYLVSMQDDSTDQDLMRIANNGDQVWAKALPQSTQGLQTFGFLPNGNLLGLRSYFNGAFKVSLVHLDADGGVAYNKDLTLFSNSYAPLRLSNGDMLLRTYKSSTQKYVFHRLDNQGNEIWQTAPAAAMSGPLVALPNGAFGLLKNVNGVQTIRLFNDLGAETGETPAIPVPGAINRLESYADGSVLASGKTLTDRGFMLRCQLDGVVVWSAESPDDAQAPQSNLVGYPTADGWGVGASDGGFYFDNTHFGILRVQANTGIFVNEVTGRVAKDNDQNCAVGANEPGIQAARITATNANSPQTWGAFSNNSGEYKIYLPAGDYTLSVESFEPFFDLCPSAPTNVSFVPNASGAATVDLPLQSPGLIHQISGHLTLDENDNCMADAGEPPLAGWPLRLVAGTKYINMKTDASGYYSVFVPDGDYQIQAEPFNFNFGICGGSVKNVTLNSATPLSETIDFIGFAKTDCAFMRNSIGSGPIRPCTTATLYAYYRNNGTRIAENATLKYTLDPALTYLSASQAPSLVDGQNLFFDLGDVPPTASSTSGPFIKIQVQTSCTLTLDDQVCIASEVSPKEFCAPTDNNWNGAIVTVEGVCEGDNAVFTIRNIGTAANSQLLDFVIAEDQIVLREGKFQLPPGGSQVEIVMPTGQDTTITIVADQEPGFPGDPTVTYSLTDCTGSGSNPSGYGGTPGPFSAQVCLAVTGSFDPNDKQAFPEGAGEEHIVRPGTPLDYTIRFQNTGTDTAFLVVLRDTLSIHLDPGSVRVQGASHPYDLILLNDNILQFTFKNILLPDSATNLEGSQGAVKFSVYPKPNLPNGTVVDNAAAIYFDFNEPVITNTVRRKYDVELLLAADAAACNNCLDVKIYPNPFAEGTTLELPEDAPEGVYHFEMYDQAGRLLKSDKFSTRQHRVQREGLPEGSYAWRIVREGLVVASGQVVAVQH